jgi:hypothetical protein
MADCTQKLTADLLIDCDNLPVGGLEVNAWIFNKTDIDRSAVTFDASNKISMTNFQLLSAKVGFKLEGIKQSNAKNYALVPKENLPDKWLHQFNGVIFNPTVNNKLQLNSLSEGGRYVVVVEQLWKGATDASAFEVLGYNVGLKLTESVNNSVENDNGITLVLASEANYEETNVPYTLLDIDYATTKAAYDNGFVQA